jgi:site-specific recombinase XerD
VGFARRRVDSDGKVRWTAVYRDLRGRIRSAGTFATEKAADRAWQRVEVKLAEGRIGDPRRGRQSFGRYVEEEWLPNHVMEATTRESYTYSINKHILPWFAKMRMAEILPSHVREWVTELRGIGVSPATLSKLRVILSAIFTTAFNDQVTFLHPCKGVKTPTVPVRARTIVTPEQFDVIYGKLPTEDAKLLVETEIESGLRWGELTELRVRDLDRVTRLLTVSRAVVEVNPKFHPDRGRFLVKDYPKDKETRRFKLSSQIAAKLSSHIDERGLQRDDLLFSIDGDAPQLPAIVPMADPESFGFTEANDRGRQYRHATLSAYSAGKCRCQPCRNSYARYRSARRAGGLDAPRRGRRRDTDGHVPRDWFRMAIWIPALKAAEIHDRVRMHDLRHAHASWLLAGGADVQVVKERLGHASICTTEKYLHTLPEADETALSALHNIRNGKGRAGRAASLPT